SLPVEEEVKPAFVLDDTCLNQRDVSTALMGKVKEFGSLSNLKMVFANEIRAKEISSWAPNFIEDNESEDDTDDEKKDEDLHEENVKMHKFTTMEGESDIEEVPETIFNNDQFVSHNSDDPNSGLKY
nr:nucleotide-binding alpha-beta plait domain-containing protein [Tanacetum cinerariifolium]GFA61208.1 nucleotide-binding alpha-beta plait domain-containing protein [Tanacetum cinerariifolium]